MNTTAIKQEIEKLNHRLQDESLTAIGAATLRGMKEALIWALQATSENMKPLFSAQKTKIETNE